MSVEGKRGSGPEVDDDANKSEVLRESCTFGKYRLVAKIGRGGMADVFLAVSVGPVGFTKLVVIKRLHHQYLNEANALRMFYDEAKLSLRLDHPNVVQTFEVDEHDHTHFLAMEYLDGLSLRGLVHGLNKRGEWFPVEFWGRILCDALHGLHYAHELTDFDKTPLGLVHRDVSPHNIFVTFDGVVKLVDFGVAKVAFQSTCTDFGTIKGKVAYMSPEQAVCQPVDRRSDIYSMGIVLWELLTRQRLYAAPTTTASLLKLVNTVAPYPSEVAPDVDPRFEEVAVKALAKNPADRYQTAKEMATALEQCIAAVGSASIEKLAQRMEVLFGETRLNRNADIQAALTTKSLLRTGEFRNLAVSSDSLSSDNHAVDAIADLDAFHTANYTDARAAAAVVVPSRGALRGLRNRNSRRYCMGAIALALVFVALGVRKWKSDRKQMVATVPTMQSIKKDSAPQSSQATMALTSLSVVSATPSSTATNAQAHPAVGASRPTIVGLPRSPALVRGDSPSEYPVASSTTRPSVALEEPGYLTIDTSPWSKVIVDGRSLGITPVFRAPLSPGIHNVLLINSEQGVQSSTTVRIQSGKTVSQRIPLE